MTFWQSAKTSVPKRSRVKHTSRRGFHATPCTSRHEFSWKVPPKRIYVCPFNRYGVDTPRRGGASVTRHEFVMHRLAFGRSNPKTGRDFGRRPRQPAGNVLATRALVPAPKTSADARRPRRCQGPGLVNQETPIGNSGPFQAGGQAAYALGNRLPAGQLQMAFRSRVSRSSALSCSPYPSLLVSISLFVTLARLARVADTKNSCTYSRTD